MKVIQVVHRFYPNIGGVETHVKETSRRLVKRGVQVEVYTADSTSKVLPNEVIEGVSIRRFRSWAPGGNYNVPLPEMLIALKKAEADLVHAHCVHNFPALFTMLLADSKQKVILTSHYCGTGGSSMRNFLWNLYRPVARLVFQRAENVICVSNYERMMVQRDFGIKPKKIVIIPNGVNVDELNSVGRNPPSGEVRILFVGRLDENKNVHKLIRATALLLNSYKTRSIRLVIVGEGGFKQQLVKLAKKLRLGEAIEWKQRLSYKELLQEYSKATIFVFPSQIEAFGIAVAEAIAMGVPTLVANDGALVEYVKAKLARGIETPITPERIAGEIREMIENGFDGYSKRKSAYFMTWDQVVDELLKLYDHVMPT